MSGDAVNWLRSHMEGQISGNEAVAQFQGMLDEQLISHASGNQEVGFVYGFYLYSITCFSKDSAGLLKNLDLCLTSSNISSFELR